MPPGYLLIVLVLVVVIVLLPIVLTRGRIPFDGPKLVW